MARTKTAPDPVDVVEALSSPAYAKLLNAYLGEAAAALKAKWIGDHLDANRSLTPAEEMALDGITGLGAQLVTATTQIESGAK